MLRSSTTGQGLTGKVHSDFIGKYNIAGGAEVTLSFSSGTAGDAYSSGKIVPLGLGKYAWHVPNAVFASLGNVSAVLSVTGGIDVHFEWLVVADSRDLATKPVNLTQIGGVAQSATDLKDFVDTGYDPATHKVAGVVLVDTTTTNTDMRGTNNAMLAASYSAPPSAATISTQVASDLATAHGAGSWATATGFSTHSAADVLTALGTGSWATSLAQASVWTPTIAGRIDVATSTRLAPTVSGRTFNVSATGEGAVELNPATQGQIDAMTRGLIAGVVGSSSSTTVVNVTSTESGLAVTDQLKGRVIIFNKDTTTAALRGQGAPIETNDTTSITVASGDAFTTAPASGDTFTIY